MGAAAHRPRAATADDWPRTPVASSRGGTRIDEVPPSGDPLALGHPRFLHRGMNGRARCARTGRRSSPVNGRALDRDADGPARPRRESPAGGASRGAAWRAGGGMASGCRGCTAETGHGRSGGSRPRRRRGSRSSSARRAGSPADAGDPYIVWSRRGPRQTSVTMAVYGTGATGTACWATREHSLPRCRARRRVNRPVHSSRAESRGAGLTAPCGVPTSHRVSRDVTSCTRGSRWFAGSGCSERYVIRCRSPCACGPIRDACRPPACPRRRARCTAAD